MKTRNHIISLVLCFAVLTPSAHAVDDGKWSQGDVADVEDIATVRAKDKEAQDFSLALGGFVADRVRGRGPERDGVKEEQAVPAPIRLIRKRKLASKEKKKLRKPENYQMKVKAQFWSVFSLSHVFFPITNSFATNPLIEEANRISQEKRGTDLTEAEIQQLLQAYQSGQLQQMGQNGSSAGGGGSAGSGGGGGGGGGGGSKFAEILFGVAAMIQAASPAVIAAIQASADVSIAKTNANAQMAMTEMASDTTKYLAESQKEIAVTQTLIARDINKNNQESTTQRTKLQLNELGSARRDNLALESRKLDDQRLIDLKRIAMAEKQLKTTQELAAAQLRLQATLTASQGPSARVASSVVRRKGGGSYRLTSAKGRTGVKALSSSRKGVSPLDLSMRVEPVRGVASESPQGFDAPRRIRTAFSSEPDGDAAFSVLAGPGSTHRDR